MDHTPNARSGALLNPTSLSAVHKSCRIAWSTTNVHFLLLIAAPPYFYQGGKFSAMREEIQQILTTPSLHLPYCVLTFSALPSVIMDKMSTYSKGQFFCVLDAIAAVILFSPAPDSDNFFPLSLVHSHQHAKILSSILKTKANQTS